MELTTKTAKRLKVLKETEHQFTSHKPMIHEIIRFKNELKEKMDHIPSGNLLNDLMDVQVKLINLIQEIESVE